MAQPSKIKTSQPQKKPPSSGIAAKPAKRAAKKKPAAKASHGALLKQYRPLAEKLRPEEVIPCRADVRVALANIRRGHASVFGEPGDKDRRARIRGVREALPEINIKKVLELEEIGCALLVAVENVVTPASTGEIDAKLKIVRDLREPMLTTAEVLAGRGLLPMATVAQIRRGSGKYDMASDGSALYRLYKDNAGKLRGAHPFTAGELETLREASEWLLARVTPSGASKAPVAKKAGGPEDIRDRLWTLVVRRHSDLRAIGYYQYRDEFDAHTPKLQSRASGAAGEVEAAEGGAPEGEAAEGTEESGEG